MRSWWLDESAYAGAEHLEPAYVAGYERKAGFDPSEDVEVLVRYGLDRHSTVIDLGAGVGTFAAAVAPLCGHVVAVDVSPAMTAALRHRIERLGIDNVTVVDAGFLSYESREPADFVYTRNALHQVPDFWKAIALDRIATWLRPDGVLRLRDLVFDFLPHEADRHIDGWLAGAVDDPTLGWTAGELAEHVRGEFSTYSWVLDSMFERTGFDILERTFRRSVYGTYTCRSCRSRRSADGSASAHA
jgi:SAM-dependent methyltransferase